MYSQITHPCFSLQQHQPFQGAHTEMPSHLQAPDLSCKLPSALDKSWSTRGWSWGLLCTALPLLSSPLTVPPRLAGGENGATLWTELLGKFQASSGARRRVCVCKRCALHYRLTREEELEGGGRAPNISPAPTKTKPRAGGGRWDLRSRPCRISRLPLFLLIPTPTSQTLTQSSGRRRLKKWGKPCAPPPSTAPPPGPGPRRFTHRGLRWSRRG